MGGVLDHIPHRFRTDLLALDGATFGQSLKEVSRVDVGDFEISINGLLDPKWNSDRAGLVAFADQVSDNPASIPQLQLCQGKFGDFMAAKSTAYQGGQDGTVAQTLGRGDIRS